MKRIQYRVTYAHGGEGIINVHARSINSGFLKAARIALRGLPEGWEISSLEFWMVTS